MWFVLGLMHFFNLYLFNRFRRRALEDFPIDQPPVDEAAGEPEHAAPLARALFARLPQYRGSLSCSLGLEPEVR